MENKLQSAGFAKLLKVLAQIRELNQAIVDFNSEIDETKNFLGSEIDKVKKLLAEENQSTVGNKEFEHKEATL